MGPILAKHWMTFVSSTYWPLLYRIGAGQSKKSDSTVFGFSSEKNKSHEFNILCYVNGKLMCEHAIMSLPFSQYAGYWFGNVWNLQAKQAQVRE